MKNKIRKLSLWTCDNWSQKKCQSEYPCQMMLPKGANIVKTACVLEKKGKWVIVPTVKLTV